MHVKLDYDEALQSKKDMLASEMDLINMIKSLNRYLLLKNLELKMKAKFYREIKKITMDIKLLEANLPKIKIPKTIRHPEEQKRAIVEDKGESDLESQLHEIQRKLRALSY